MIISGSILSVITSQQLFETCNDIIKHGADSIHLDVISDSDFDNIILPLLLKIDGKYKCDVHLMVDDIVSSYAKLINYKINLCIIHYETKSVDLHISNIKKLGMSVGLAINPETPIDKVFEYCDQVETILIMTVNPGKGGQKILPDVLHKIKILRDKYPKINIYVDGGINLETLKICKDLGSNGAVSGSYIMNDLNNINELKKV